jgi:cell wall-associated NlpC family hydrolase
MTDYELRQKIVAEALSWVGTPYHLGARVKGAGVDCATLILQVMVDCDIFTDERLGQYSGDWWCHANEERYALAVLRHATKVLDGVCYRSTQVLPGNIVLGRVMRSSRLNHGAIVVEYPMVVHACAPAVVLVDITRHPMWAYCSVEIFDPLRRAEL